MMRGLEAGCCHSPFTPATSEHHTLSLLSDGETGTVQCIQTFFHPLDPHAAKVQPALDLDAGPDIAPPLVDPRLLPLARADLPVAVERGQHNVARSEVGLGWRVGCGREGREARLEEGVELRVCGGLSRVLAWGLRGRLGRERRGKWEMGRGELCDENGS